MDKNNEMVNFSVHFMKQLNIPITVEEQRIGLSESRE